MKPAKRLQRAYAIKKVQAATLGENPQ